MLRRPFLQQIVVDGAFGVDRQQLAALCPLLMCAPLTSTRTRGPAVTENISGTRFVCAS